MNITPEQYLEDYDMLYQQLIANYPYFGVVLRKYGVDIKNLYEQYRKQMITCKNDDDFWQLIKDFIDDIQYTGHITAWGSRYMSQVKGLKDFVLKYPEYDEFFQPYLDKLDNKISQKNYIAMQNFYQYINLAVELLNDNANNDNLIEDDPYSEEPEINNVTTEIIKDKKIAYLKN